MLFGLKRKGRENVGEPSWMKVINDFKSIASTISNAEELEKYLQSVNHYVRDCETDYAFLVAFNSIIRETRKRIALD